MRSSFLHKVILFLCLVLWNGQPLTAQLQRWELAPELGGGLSFLRGNEFLKKYYSYRVSYAGGVGLAVNVNEFLSIKGGPFYEQKGSNFDLSAFSQQSGPRGYHKFEYLTLPIFVRLTFGNDLAFFVNAGPYISFLIRHTEHVDAFGGFQGSTYINTEYFKKFDQGFLGGVGIKSALNKNYGVSLEARGTIGFIDISEVSLFYGGEIKNAAVYLLFGYYYRFG